MKNIKSIFYICLAACCAMTAVSCSDDFMDEINKNENNPSDVEVKFIIPEIELRTAQNITGGDINTYLGSYIEYWVGTFNQLYNAETRTSEIYKSSTFNNCWESIYECIRNSKIAIEKASDETSGDALALGIAQIYLAYNAAFVTDMFGDTPYSQVGDYKTYPNPVADKQEEIYKDVFKLLNSAIENLEGASNTLGTYDYMFKGDASKWQKTAYGLMARYTMRLINRSSDKNADYDKVVKYCDLSFADASEQAAFNPGYDDNNWSPLFDFQYSRDYISSSHSLFAKLKAYGDPRAPRAYTYPYDEGIETLDEVEANVAPNGEPEVSQYAYAYDAYSLCCYSPVMIISYHELQFLKAEALARKGNTEEAKEALNNAVVAGLLNAEECFQCYTATMGYDVSGTAITEFVAQEYFNDVLAPALAKATAKELVKEIMIQKYIALWNANGESAETYNDIRRLKALGEGSTYVFENPKADRFPLRLPYGADDTTTNPNIQDLYGDGQYVLTENVWWAGGSR